MLKEEISELAINIVEYLRSSPYLDKEVDEECLEIIKRAINEKIRLDQEKKLGEALWF